MEPSTLHPIAGGIKGYRENIYTRAERSISVFMSDCAGVQKVFNRLVFEKKKEYLSTFDL